MIAGERELSSWLDGGWDLIIGEKGWDLKMEMDGTSKWGVGDTSG